MVVRRRRREVGVAGPIVSGQEVVELQRALAELGYGSGVIDGKLGPATEAAVRKLQRDRGLPADRELDELAVRELIRVIAAGTPPPGARSAVSKASPPIDLPSSSESLPPVEVPSPGESSSSVEQPSGLEETFAGLPGQLTAYQIADEVLFQGRKVLAAPPNAPSKPADEWLLEIRPLFDMTVLPVPDPSHVAIGLALLDDRLAAAVGVPALLAAAQSLQPPILAVLTPEARARWQAIAARDDAATHFDRPATDDQLGRLTFARVLGLRLREVRNAYYGRDGKTVPPPSAGPFVLHLHGAWGSGKSSLLGFVAEELRRPTMSGPDGRTPVPWIVVEFNAWQHQRIAPPWWWLMSCVYLSGKRELRAQSTHRWLAFQARDFAWRARQGWVNLLGVLIGLAAIGGVIWAGRSIVGSDPGAGLKALATLATSVGAILGVALTVWGVTRGIRDWLLVRSAAGARSGLARSHDPLATVKSRFEQVVHALGLPLAVVVDDLDRCQPNYVVELLEGIQTLFAAAPVVYVVAADGRWVRDSFEEVYKTFLDMPSEPGRPLGYHFLEKTFQLSADVPRLTDRLRERYFQSLLGVDRAPDVPVQPGPAAPTAGIAAARTEEELRAAVAATSTPEQEGAAIEEALIRAQSSDIRAHTEHRLQGFDHLLEPNPRAMKRLVNAYGLARDVELVEAGASLAHGPEAIEQLALWTILRLRWPLLALHLEAHPADVDKVGKRTTAATIPADLWPLFREPELIDVVRGAGVHARLDEATVRRIVGRVRRP